MLVFAGENPGMRLFDPSTGEPSTVAFWWRSTWSIAGAGAVVIVWSRAAREPNAVWTNDRRLAGWLNGTLTCRFPEFESIDLAHLGVRDASFRGRIEGSSAEVSWGDGRHHYQLGWGDVLDRRISHIEDFASTGLTLRNVFMPTRTAWLTRDGVRLGGAPDVEAGSRPTSTAFLAVCETWERPG
jgi:hypothetical protein